MILQADARHIPLASESVHCVVTSPPYWGLRDYGIEPSVWGGREDCGHEWGDSIVVKQQSGWDSFDSYRNETDRGHGGYSAENPSKSKSGVIAIETKATNQGSFCLLCSAWRGVLGLEPTPELYVAHMVEIFREVKRVLRKDGTCWVNLGDSYASQGHTQNDGDTKGEHLTGGGLRSWGEHRQAVMKSTGLGVKPKDLCGIPWRVAFALQADGWWLRSDIIWSKPNPMPESVTDRPTKSHEYIFLLTKSSTYYFDQDAVREQSITLDPRRPYTSKGAWQLDGRDESMQHGGEDRNGNDFTSRNIRTVWTMPTEAFPDAHFATFPSELAMRCVLAGSPLDGTVLDPFLGSGTTIAAAQDCGRVGIGLDLKPDYLRMAQRRSAQLGLGL